MIEAVRRASRVLCGASAVFLLVGSPRAETTVSLMTAAVLPVQDRVGDTDIKDVVEDSLFWTMSEHAKVLSRAGTRDVLRRLRIRNADAALPGGLRDLATELGADWLVSAVVHDAERRATPRLTVSVRVYLGSTGELVWAGFRGLSGLDGRSALGYGVIRDLEGLGPRLVQRLLADFEAFNEKNGAESSGKEADGQILGVLAIVPFAGLTDQNPTSNAETVTEAARATMFEMGTALAPAGCTNTELRRQRLPVWGAIDADARSAVGSVCGADVILTGTVERYDVGGSDTEPQPFVGLGMRLLDVETGKILWAGGSERQGWGKQGLFRLGRIYSRGALTEDMMRSLSRELLRSRRRSLRRGQERE